jgi:hypothetical protein
MHVPLQMHRFDFHGQVHPLRSDLETAERLSCFNCYRLKNLLESEKKTVLTKGSSGEQYEDTYVSIISWRMLKKSGMDEYDGLNDSRSCQPKTLLE